MWEYTFRARTRPREATGEGNVRFFINLIIFIKIFSRPSWNPRADPEGVLHLIVPTGYTVARPRFHTDLSLNRKGVNF